MEKKSKIRLGSLVLGILTAVAIVISQLFYFHAPAEIKKEIKQEQQEKPSGDEAFLTQPSTTVTSSAHVEPLQENFCLFEIILENEDNADRSSDFGLPIHSFFQTLFGTLISPNAP